MYLVNQARLRCVFPLAILGIVANTSLAAISWEPNIPDLFQHQRWGSDETIGD